MKKKRQSKRAGLKPLGPVPDLKKKRRKATETEDNFFTAALFWKGKACFEVMAREEAVDPLQKVDTWTSLSDLTT